MIGGAVQPTDADTWRQRRWLSHWQFMQLTQLSTPVTHILNAYRVMQKYRAIGHSERCDIRGEVASLTISLVQFYCSAWWWKNSIKRSAKMHAISWHTILQPRGKVLHTFINGFLQQGSSHLLQCVHQLWNWFGYSMVFVGGYCKQQRCVVLLLVT